MSRTADIAYRLRWLILVAATLCILGTVLWWAVLFESKPVGLLILAVLFATEWLFLLPRRRWMLRLSETGRPLKGAVVSGAAVAVVVSFALLLTLIELFYDRGQLDLQIGPIAFWACVFLAWTGWAAVFYLTWRRDATRYAELSRLARRLTAGTILEMIVAAPVFAFVDDPDSCYCARGSFWGLIFGATCLSWAFGPGVVLLFLYERHRWLTAAHLCRSCGYDLRGTTAAGRTSCPECGADAKAFPASGGADQGPAGR